MHLKNTVGINCRATAMSTVLNYYGYPLSECMCFGLGASLDFSCSSVRFRKKHFHCFSGNNDNDYNYSADLLNLDIQTYRPYKSKELHKIIERKIREGCPLIARVSIDKYIKLLTEKYFSSNSSYGVATQEIYDKIQTSAGVHVTVIADIGKEFIWLYEQNVEKPVLIPLNMYYQAANPKATSIVHPANTIYCIKPTMEFARIQLIMEQIIFTAICDNMSQYLYSNSSWYGVEKIKTMGSKVIEMLQNNDRNNLMMFRFFCDIVTGGGYYRRMYSHFLQEVDAKYLKSNLLKEEAIGYMRLSRKWTKLSKKLETYAKTEVDKYSIGQIQSEINEIFDREYLLASNLLKKGREVLHVY